MAINIPDNVPAWVRAALDTWQYQNGQRINGFRVLTNVHYPDLQSTSEYNKFIEDQVFHGLEKMALRWARSEFRLWIDDFEHALSQCEIEARTSPLATKFMEFDEKAYRYNNDMWVYAKTAELMRSKNYIVTPFQAMDMLDIVSSVYELADYVGEEVRVLAKGEARPDINEKTIYLLREALQKAA